MARRSDARALSERPRRGGFAAAGRQLDLSKKEANGYRRRAQSADWQRDCLAYFSAIGVVKQATYFLANTCSLTRLFIAVQPDPEQDPIPAPEGTLGLAEARDALDRLKAGAKGGHSGVIQRAVVLMKATGECYLVGLDPIPAVPAMNGQPERAAQPERWLVASVSELRSQGQGSSMTYELVETRGGDPRKLTTDMGDAESEQPGAMVVRIWQEDAEYAEEADCALRGTLNDCEELLAHGRSVRASLRNRYALNGIFLVPSEADLGPIEENADEDPEAQEDADDPQAAWLAKKIMDTMVATIENEGSAAGAAPIVLRTPSELIEKYRHLTFDRPSDSDGKDRHECIERLAMGLDIPLEEVVGMGGGKSSGALFMSGNTAQQMEQKLFNRYGHPTMVTLCEALSVGYLRPMVETTGVDASQLMVWYEPGDAISEPDPAESADNAFDRGAISWEAYRQAKRYTDDDAPTDDELSRRQELGLLGKATAQQQQTKDSSSLPSSPPAQQAASAALDVASWQAPTNGNGHSVTAAGRARANIAQRLSTIERETRLRVSEFCDFAMFRAIEKAGARVRNKAARNSRIRDALRTVPAHAVTATLGRSVVADALGTTDDDLLRDTFDEQMPLFDKRVATAQQQTLDALTAEFDLDESEIQALQQQQDRDRDAAWLFLAGALLAVAHDRLYSPQPSQPPRGEFDANASVPPGIVREALARAGGAQSATAVDGEPNGGVALGQLVQGLWTQHGRVVDGWRWLYGDPGSRTTPFDPHLNLDGVEFTSWQDDQLVNDNDWPDTAFLRPGDHLWCQCDFEAIGLSDSSDDSSDESDAALAEG